MLLVQLCVRGRGLTLRKVVVLLLACLLACAGEDPVLSALVMIALSQTSSFHFSFQHGENFIKVTVCSVCIYRKNINPFLFTAFKIQNEKHVFTHTHTHTQLVRKKCEFYVTGSLNCFIMKGKITNKKCTDLAGFCIFLHLQYV